MPRWFRKFKKKVVASKHPVSLADSTHDTTTDPPSFDVDPALDTKPEGRFRSVDLAIDGVDLAIIGTTSGKYSLTPLPEKEAGNQSTPKTTTTTATPSDGPSDGGDVVGECLAPRSWDWN